MRAGGPTGKGGALKYGHPKQKGGDDEFLKCWRYSPECTADLKSNGMGRCWRRLHGERIWWPVLRHSSRRNGNMIEKGGARVECYCYKWNSKIICLGWMSRQTGSVVGRTRSWTLSTHFGQCESVHAVAAALEDWSIWLGLIMLQELPFWSCWNIRQARSQWEAAHYGFTGPAVCCLSAIYFVKAVGSQQKTRGFVCSA